MYKSSLKRIIDVFVSLIGFILLLPVFLIVFLILLINNKGKVFFVQKRPGFNEKIFEIIKFKTMNDKKDSKGDLLPNELRLTSIGKTLRKTSLDEIPQLINVIKGDMSLVGPRPLKVDYLELYSEEQKRRHIVKPGITGWAQVNGRNQISNKRKIELDVWYVDNLNFLLDIKILYLTFLKVIRKEGVNKEGLDKNKPFNRFN